MTSPTPSAPRAPWLSGAIAAGPALSLCLALPLLQRAARDDRHWRTTGSALVDHRTGAGLFVLYALVAATPALITAVLHPRSRTGAGWLAAVVLGLGLLCEAVVSVAPEPWFTF